MELLGDVRDVEYRFCPFGDNVSVAQDRSMFAPNVHRLKNHFGDSVSVVASGILFWSV
jgi:hypothetical protein